MQSSPRLHGSRPKSSKPLHCSRSVPLFLLAQLTALRVVLGVLVTLLPTACEKAPAPPEPGPPDVEVAEVIQQDVPIYREWVAQLNGPINAAITPKVQGYLLTQSYNNGFFVKKGSASVYDRPPAVHRLSRPGKSHGRTGAGERRPGAKERRT